ncbi:hypothetical protein QGM71_01120 [Virgibacillus sp. C22-A2]|uniref:Phage protein n=1 Tax=Virgibacillus tibetensis TaxID=3042313 RepID=A0ABU6KAC8_9BACI|nr:hypothetical protein [Virgibacillus sp. C22-A2]
MSEWLKKIKENYSNMVDIALSSGETLPNYEIEVADLNYLIQQAEYVKELEKRNAEIIDGINFNNKEYGKIIGENQRYKQALEEIAFKQHNVEPKRVVVKLQSKAREVLGGNDNE